MPPPQPIPAGRRLPGQERAPPPAAFSGPGAASGRAAGGPGLALALRLLLPLLGAAALPGARSRPGTPACGLSSAPSSRAPSAPVSSHPPSPMGPVCPGSRSFEASSQGGDVNPALSLAACWRPGAGESLEPLDLCVSRVFVWARPALQARIGHGGVGARPGAALVQPCCVRGRSGQLRLHQRDAEGGAWPSVDGAIRGSGVLGREDLVGTALPEMVQLESEHPGSALQPERSREQAALHSPSPGEKLLTGFHIIQTIYGCDLQEDNTTRGFYQDSYDGRDFLTFDKETVTWVSADIGAQISKRRWDAEIDDNQGWKRYLEEECISWLRSSLEYGKETLQRKVHPTARVSDRSSHDGLTTLSCKVSGFYPRDITVTWLRNGESRQQETYSEGILPSGDGTYQTWVTMEIDPKIKAHYSCHVEHESLLEPLSVSWEPNNNLLPTVAGVITAVVLIGVIIGVVVIWKKKRPGKKGDGYAVAQANDQGSSGSDLSAQA
ncbi:class I histocompatibility antigen, Gogo-B*0103 alpha chain-like isoform X3 [Caretta caretta]|uniref:class I histocompatibility antigen, Gogo-B*0103 alpha chain-like isoform X3 n=1 Tax=Caretta caretta TaxID=8467 RepID=UPI003F4C4AB3